MFECFLNNNKAVHFVYFSTLNMGIFEKIFNFGIMMFRTRGTSEEARRKGRIAIKKLGNGAVRLSYLEGNKFAEPINADRLKQYFA